MIGWLCVCVGSLYPLTADYLNIKTGFCAEEDDRVVMNISV